MSKRILFFSCEPGGAEVLTPVIRLLDAQPEFEVTTIGYGYALDRFSKNDISFSEIAQIDLEDTNLIDNNAPDLIITSAASLPTVDMSEKHLWRQARLRGIPTLAMLDQWQNYAARFSGISVNERLAYQPDWINCLNETGWAEMVDEGFDATKLVPMGHPYLSSLKRNFTALDISSLRIAQRIEASDRVVLFVSEPIAEHYGVERGYDQYQVLDYFLTNLDTECTQTRVLVKLHPKDCPSSFAEISEKFKGLRVRFISNEISPLECLAISDYVFGMSSVMLIEAYVIGKLVASLQPGLLVEDPMVLSRHKLIPCITSYKKINPLKLNFQSGDLFDVEFKAECFQDFVRRLMVSVYSFGQSK